MTISFYIYFINFDFYWYIKYVRHKRKTMFYFNDTFLYYF